MLSLNTSRLAILVVVCLVSSITPSEFSFVFAQRPDEGPTSQLLRDAFFTNAVAVGGALYQRTDELGPRMRRFDPERDEKVVYVAVFDARYSAKVRGELIRPNGQRHGAFSYELDARVGSTWRSKAWWWSLSGLKLYQGEWQLRLWVDEHPMGRYYCMLGKEPANVASGWWADARTGCRVWNEVPQPGEAVTWSGACGPDGIATGYGIEEFRYDGKVSRYEGEVRDGKKYGGASRPGPAAIDTKVSGVTATRTAVASLRARAATDTRVIGATDASGTETAGPRRGDHSQSVLEFPRTEGKGARGCPRSHVLGQSCSADVALLSAGRIYF